MWSGPTLVVISIFVAWYLLIRGIFDVAISLSHTHVQGLVDGADLRHHRIGLGAWAIGNPDRSVLLFVTIIGIWSIFKGVADLVGGFSYRNMKKDSPRPETPLPRRAAARRLSPWWASGCAATGVSSSSAPPRPWSKRCWSMRSRRPRRSALATQITAPPPFGVFHDLRWIVVYHESWIGLAFELLAFVLFRSLLTAVCLRAAWPHDIPPEPWALTIRRSVLFTVIVGVLLAPWAALMFALAVVSLSWLFFVAIPVVLMLALLVHGGAVTGSWWRGTLSARSLAWVLVAFVALSVFGSIMTTCPDLGTRSRRRARGGRERLAVAACCRGGAAPPASAARVSRSPRSGSPVCWSLSSAEPLRASPCRRRRRCIWSSPAEAATQWTPSSATGGNAARRRHRLQHQVGRPRRSVRARRLSRNGVSRTAARREARRCRIPLTTRTVRCPISCASFAVRSPCTTAPLGGVSRVVAESEGALLAKAYLAATPSAPVENLLILSPLVAPGRVYYPSEGEEGWGAAGALGDGGLRVGTWRRVAGRRHSRHAISPFDRRRRARVLRGLMSCSLPHVHQLAVLPLDTGVSAPAPTNFRFPYTVVPAFHGGMLDDADDGDARHAPDRGQDAFRSGDGWSIAEAVIQAGTSAWQVPQLTNGINASWSHEPDPDNCAAIRAHLQRHEMR